MAVPFLLLVVRFCSIRPCVSITAEMVLVPYSSVQLTVLYCTVATRYDHTSTVLYSLVLVSACTFARIYPYEYSYEYEYS